MGRGLWHLAAICSVFDKMCGCAVTLDLGSPRRPKRLPVVLSQEEIMQMLEAAPSLRDKLLLLGLMFATGARVSEAVRLRWRDFDFDRRTVSMKNPAKPKPAVAKDGLPRRTVTAS